MHFDDYMIEEEIFAKLIEERRKMRLSPLNCMLSKRDRNTHKKYIQQGKVLDFNPCTKQYLIEENTPEMERYIANRLCI